MPIADQRAARLAQEPMREMAPHEGFAGAVHSLRDIWGRRELLTMLVKREIKARYKDSTLGLVWSLIRPLTQLLIYYLVMGKVLGAQRAIPDFAIFVFSGLTAWALFSEIVSVGTGSIIANGGIIKKIKLPREIFPLSSVGSALFNFMIQMIILVLAALILRGLNWGNIGYLFVAIGILVVWGTTFALFLSAVNVYLRDVQYIVEVALLIGFWASPVVYSWQHVRDAASQVAIGPLLETIYAWNPATLAIVGMQRFAWKAGGDSLVPTHLMGRMLIVLAIGLVLLFISQRVFDRLQRNFAQEI